MQRSNLTFLLIFLAGVAVMGAYYLSTRPEAVPVVVTPPPEGPAETEQATIEGDEPGPFLAISVAGEATGTITIDLFEQAAPGHVEQIVALAEAGEYDGVVFHRVIEGFMAQTGDVEFGRSGDDMRNAGMGGSDRPDLTAEFTDIPFDRGIVGMARSQDDNSANSQFFIMFAPGHFLNGQYTVVGKVTAGLDVLDAIKLGKGQNGSVIGEPDQMSKVEVTD